MSVTINLRKMLHRKSPEYCTPLAPGNTVAGGHIVADKGGLLPENDGIAYIGGASAIWNYNADEDAWIQGPNSGIAGTFGAGACSALKPQAAPAGNTTITATGGTTTTISTSLTFTRNLAGRAIRVIAGTGLGYQGVITKSTCGASSSLVLSPASGVAFDNTTQFQLFSGSLWFFNPGAAAVGFSVYDVATNSWTARSVTGLPTSFATDGQLIGTASVSSNNGLGFVSSTAIGGIVTTLSDITKTWPTNAWTNYQVRIVSGTGIGQIRTITSNTATALTVAAWTVTPDATSVYVIEGNDDYLYLLGNNAVTMYRYSVSGNTWTTLAPTAARAGAPGAGFSANWIDSVQDSSWSDGTYTTMVAPSILRQNGRYIYSFRGGATNILDVYDIAANTWYSGIAYGNQMETFTTGSSSVDQNGYIYIMKEATGRIYKFDVGQNELNPFALIPVPQGAALTGTKMFVTTFTESSTRLNYLYTLSHTRSELIRWVII